MGLSTQQFCGFCEIEWMVGRVSARTIICSELPVGYEATTPLTQSIGVDSDVVAQFGFRLISREEPVGN